MSSTTQSEDLTTFSFTDKFLKITLSLDANYKPVSYELAKGSILHKINDDGIIKLVNNGDSSSNIEDIQMQFNDF